MLYQLHCKYIYLLIGIYTHNNENMVYNTFILKIELKLRLLIFLVFAGLFCDVKDVSIYAHKS